MTRARKNYRGDLTAERLNNWSPQSFINGEQRGQHADNNHQAQHGSDGCDWKIGSGGHEVRPHGQQRGNRASEQSPQ